MIDQELSRLLSVKINIVKGLKRYRCLYCYESFVAPEDPASDMFLQWNKYHLRNNCKQDRMKK